MDFCNLCKLKYLFKVPTCFKNPDNPKAIHLMSTNSVRSFQNSRTLETGLSDLHKITVTVLESYLEKEQPKILSYRDFRKFSSNNFRTQILQDFSTQHLSSDSPSLNFYVDICIRAFDIYAPKEKKYLGANNSPFMNKAISKPVMDRTKLRNKLLKIDLQKINWLIIAIETKSKRDYYNSLDNRNVTENKLFWKTVKPFFSDKSPMRQKITLIEKDEILGNI